MQGTKCRRNIAENFNRLSRVHERYRQTTDRQRDGRAIAYSERDREFKFAKNRRLLISSIFLLLHTKIIDTVSANNEPSDQARHVLAKMTFCWRIKGRKQKIGDLSDFNYSITYRIFNSLTILLHKYQLSWWTRATRCIAANVLQTKVDIQCDKLTTKLNWQRLWRSMFSSYSELFVESRQF